ncbi:Saccharopine dehydrogenase, NADP-dependent [Roseibium suaedae]|uniref:Saccharopine dehydrogenase, NADP-dependent n=1 Tax=Roseibium suaedae TaxID=735517 RepID=A0A1M7GV29_9HYPH|nr:Saccharopine dehydrogenase, NADP-dependent [Roseibium suaedae]
MPSASSSETRALPSTSLLKSPEDQDTIKRCRVLVIGGTGVFGSRLVEALLKKPEFEVLAAGRNADKLNALCKQLGDGTPVVLDSNAADLEERLLEIDPDITVDAAGPFQAYGNNDYRIAHAALNAGSHYLDLSDDAGFTSGIRALNDSALAAGKTVLSGVSSVPALSSAAVDHMRPSFEEIDLIESAILPGNRAPRGLSVIQAILAQTGQPISAIRDGKPAKVTGWSGLRRHHLQTAPGTKPISTRWSSFIGAPDLELFPEAYQARSVLFRAGLELSVLHLGLWVLSLPVRLKILSSLRPLARLTQTVATWFEGLGTDRGGMDIAVSGKGRDGRSLTRRWTLIAQNGDGPHIPALAAEILCRKLQRNEVLPGARPCLGEISLQEVEQAAASLDTSTFEDSITGDTVFERALGRDIEILPQAIRDLHRVFDLRKWTGEASVERGTHFIVPLVCMLAGFPPPAESLPISVTIERKNGSETWTRRFGAHKMVSVLSCRNAAGSGVVTERFGPMAFDIHLKAKDGGLSYPVVKGRVFGIPVPRFCLPLSDTLETAADGMFRFKVEISLPLVGRIVRYEGWLRPDT